MIECQFCPIFYRLTAVSTRQTVTQINAQPFRYADPIHPVRIFGPVLVGRLARHLVGCRNRFFHTFSIPSVHPHTRGEHNTSSSDLRAIAAALHTNPATIAIATIEKNTAP